VIHYLIGQVGRRLAVLGHVEEATGKVAVTCRYFGISRGTSRLRFSSHCQALTARCRDSGRRGVATLGRSGPWPRRTRAPPTPAHGGSRRRPVIVAVLVRAGSARHREPLVLAGRQRSRPAYKNRRSHGMHRSGLGRPSTHEAGFEPPPEGGQLLSGGAGETAGSRRPPRPHTPAGPEAPLGDNDARSSLPSDHGHPVTLGSREHHHLDLG
jgi:hypothetical protein